MPWMRSPVHGIRVHIIRNTTMTKENLIFLDIETGGFSKKKNGICEIAIIITDGDLKEICSDQWIVKPYERCPSVQEQLGQLVSYKPEAMAVNGISMEEIENGCEAKQVACSIWAYLNKYGGKVVGHNAKSFDGPWIEEFLLRFAYVFKLEVIDTLLIAKENKTNYENHKLATLLGHYGIKNDQSHRAMGDTRATMELYRCLTLI